MNVPSRIVAGDSVTWLHTLLDYPAPTWELHYTLHNVEAAYPLTATAEGSAHRATLTAADTAPWLPGRYQWTAYVTDGTHRYTAGKGVIIIEPDPAKAVPRDTRSHAERMLAAIEAAIEGTADAGQLSLLEHGVGIRNWKKNPELLLKWRTHYQLEVSRERAGGPPRPKARRVTFGRVR